MASITITPAVIDISLPMGITKSIDYVFKKINGTPIDITTATILFTVKDVASDQNPTDGSALIAKELAITGGTSGMAQLFLTQVNTFIPAREYFYDIKIVQPYATAPTTVDLAVIGSFTITDASTNRVVGIA